jgi:aminoglycoside N3'-acetyltransferase
VPLLTQVIAATDRPRTRDSLTGDLRALRLGPGQFVMLHVSMKALGFVVGGAVPLLDAAGAVAIGQVGSARAMLVDGRAAVDTGVKALG